VIISRNDLNFVQFGVSDIIRRAQGDFVGALGLNPSECPYDIIASHSHWRLRDYGGEDHSRSLLIIAAPIKRPYIWDLTPGTSAISFCLRHGMHVHLLEWMPASPHADEHGVDDSILAISEAVAMITTAQDTKPCLIGHSLAGTLAAIYGAFLPESIKALILLDAPLCFEPSESAFRDALVTLVPENVPESAPFPGLGFVVRKRAGIPRYICLVTPSGRFDKRCRPACNGNSCTGGALGSR
jgi:polyhydroxyalkanoate synthase